MPTEDEAFDLYQISRYRPARDGQPWSSEVVGYTWFTRRTDEYEGGEWYGMRRDEYHSIEFSRGARVLFFEGPDQDASSCYLEPVVAGRVVPTFQVADWMYRE